MCRKGFNLESAKLHNLRVILDIVRENPNISRIEIAKHSSLSGQTVSNLVAELIKINLLTVSGVIKKCSAGKPSDGLKINSLGGLSIGIKLEYRVANIVLCDFNLDVLKKVDVTWDSKESLKDSLLYYIKDILGLKSLKNIPFLGLGIISPGPFDNRGKIFPVSIEDNIISYIVKSIKDECRCNIFLENDANAAVKYEIKKDKSLESLNVIYLYISYGLGAGVYFNGYVFKGVTGNSGEIGHFIARKDGKLCSCGNKGCLERYLSLVGLAESIKKKILPIQEVKQVIESLTKDEISLVNDWLNQIRSEIGNMLDMISTTFDPDLVYIGGDCPSWIIERIRSFIEENHEIQSNLRVSRSTNTNGIELIGAEIATKEGVNSIMDSLL